MSLTFTVVDSPAQRRNSSVSSSLSVDTCFRKSGTSVKKVDKPLIPSCKVGELGTNGYLLIRDPLGENRQLNSSVASFNFVKEALEKRLASSNFDLSDCVAFV